MRRTPSQARGRERVDRILAAAAEEFAENGFEQATTSAIADRAHTSIGSVYQFFSDKNAILDALVERYRADLSAIGVVLVPDPAAGADGPELDDVLGPALEGLVQYSRANPAFPVLLGGSPLRRGERAGEGVRQALRDVVARLLAAKQGDTAAVARMATVLTDIVAGLLPAAVADDELLPHLRAATVGYLRRITEESARGG